MITNNYGGWLTELCSQNLFCPSCDKKAGGGRPGFRFEVITETLAEPSRISYEDSTHYRSYSWQADGPVG